MNQIQKKRQSVETNPKNDSDVQISKDFNRADIAMHNIIKKNIYIMKNRKKIWQRNINYNK